MHHERTFACKKKQEKLVSKVAQSYISEKKNKYILKAVVLCFLLHTGVKQNAKNPKPNAKTRRCFMKNSGWLNQLCSSGNVSNKYSKVALLDALCYAQELKKV